MPTDLLAKRLLRLSIVAVLVVVAGVLVVHLSGILEDTDHRTPHETTAGAVLVEAAAQIAEESRGGSPQRVVEAAPLPPLGDDNARTTEPDESTLPEGLTHVAFNGQMAKAHILDRREAEGTRATPSNGWIRRRRSGVWRLRRRPPDAAGPSGG